MGKVERNHVHSVYSVPQAKDREAVLVRVPIVPVGFQTGARVDVVVGAIDCRSEIAELREWSRCSREIAALSFGS